MPERNSHEYLVGRTSHGVNRTRLTTRGPEDLYAAGDTAAEAFGMTKVSFTLMSLRTRGIIGETQALKGRENRGKNLSIGETIITPDHLNQYDTGPTEKRDHGKIPTDEYEEFIRRASGRKESLSDYTNRSIALRVVLLDISALEGLRNPSTPLVPLQIGDEIFTI